MEDVEKMDLNKNGQLLRALRKEKGLTQSELAEKLGVVAKTVSKWETGHGFPDIATLPTLAETLSVSEKTLLSGDLIQNQTEIGNIQRTKFYICPHCGCSIQGIGKAQIVCCGKPLPPLQPKAPDDNHHLTISEIEDEFYVEISHKMDKTHYISFLWYVGYDRVLTVKLYPEQDCSVRIPKVYSGKILYYCNNDGLFEYQLQRKK